MSDDVYFTTEEYEALLQCEFDELPELAAQYVVAKNPKDESWFAKLKRVFDQVSEFVGKNSALHHSVCVEFNACDKIKKAEDVEAGLREIIRPIVSDWIEKVVGFVSRRFIAGVVAYVAFYIVRMGIKSYCRCST